MKWILEFNKVSTSGGLLRGIRGWTPSSNAVWWVGDPLYAMRGWDKSEFSVGRSGSQGYRAADIEPLHVAPWIALIPSA